WQNLDKAIASSNDQFDFEVRWHLYFLNPSAPKEGVVKKVHYMEKFGPQSEIIKARMAELFRGHGLDYDVDGLTGNTLDNHRLITFAGHQGYDKQNALVEELHLGYFTQGKYIGDKEFLVEATKKVGIEGAAEFLDNPNKGVQEVYAELEKYSDHITGIPYYVVCDSSDGSMEKKQARWPNPEVFARAFQQPTKSM
ncbi:hypothetical protein IFM89_019546, partial [Coptis chinensis]